MFATFNLQLMPTATLDAAPETPTGTPVLTTEPLEIEATGFARLMQLQTDTGIAADIPHGDFVPEGGNILPVAEPIPTDGEDLPAIDVAASLISDLEGDVKLDTDVPGALMTWAPVPTVPGAPIDKTVSAIPQLQQPAPQASAIDPRIEINKQAGATRVGSESLLTDTQKPLPPLTVETNPITQGSVAAAPVVRDIMMTRPEQASVSRDVAAAPQTIISPESEVVPRVAAMPEMNIATDRSASNLSQTPSISALANAVNQASGGALRDPGLVSQVATDLVRTPVSDSGWGERIGQRVVMMAGNQVQQAEIRLTPAELGPVRVQIAVEDGATNVTFQAQHAVTREAIEAAMPRLREMLADSGLSLGQTNVGGDGVAEGQRDRRETAEAARNSDDGNEFAEDAQPERQKTVTSDGLIDTFA